MPSRLTNVSAWMPQVGPGDVAVEDAELGQPELREPDHQDGPRRAGRAAGGSRVRPRGRNRFRKPTAGTASWNELPDDRARCRPRSAPAGPRMMFGQPGREPGGQHAAEGQRTRLVHDDVEGEDHAAAEGERGQLPAAAACSRRSRAPSARTPGRRPGSRTSGGCSTPAARSAASAFFRSAIVWRSSATVFSASPLSGDACGKTCSGSSWVFRACDALCSNSARPLRVGAHPVGHPVLEHHLHLAVGCAALGARTIRPLRASETRGGPGFDVSATKTSVQPRPGRRRRAV